MSYEKYFTELARHKVCQAIDCKKLVHPEDLMCWGCWKLVPKDLQQAVLQTRQGASKQDYDRACHNARSAVNRIRTVTYRLIGEA